MLKVALHPFRLFLDAAQRADGGARQRELVARWSCFSHSLLQVRVAMPQGRINKNPKGSPRCAWSAKSRRFQNSRAPTAIKLVATGGDGVYGSGIPNPKEYQEAELVPAHQQEPVVHQNQTALFPPGVRYGFESRGRRGSPTVNSSLGNVLALPWCHLLRTPELAAYSIHLIGNRPGRVQSITSGKAGIDRIPCARLSSLGNDLDEPEAKTDQTLATVRFTPLPGRERNMVMNTSSSPSRPEPAEFDISAMPPCPWDATGEPEPSDGTVPAAEVGKKEAGEVGDDHSSAGSAR